MYNNHRVVGVLIVIIFANLSILSVLGLQSFGVISSYGTISYYEKAQFGMGFHWDTGDSRHWYDFGEGNLEPMYQAFDRECEYLKEHGFTFIETFATQGAYVTWEKLSRILEIAVSHGLRILLRFPPNNEPDFSVTNLNASDQLYQYYHNLILQLDARPDLCDKIDYIDIANEVHRSGTYEQLQDYLQYIKGQFQSWLGETIHLRDKKLLMSFSIFRLGHGSYTPEMYSLIAEYSDLPTNTWYPRTDAMVEQDIAKWRSLPSLEGRPFVISELNNGERGNKQQGYIEETYYGYVPWHWIEAQIDLGAETIILHQSNSGSGEDHPYAFFDKYGEPLEWLSQELAPQINEYSS